jgi:hypothetical protein
MFLDGRAKKTDLVVTMVCYTHEHLRMQHDLKGRVTNCDQFDLQITA